MVKSIPVVNFCLISDIDSIALLLSLKDSFESIGTLSQTILWSVLSVDPSKPFNTNSIVLLSFWSLLSVLISLAMSIIEPIRLGKFASLQKNESPSSRDSGKLYGCCSYADRLDGYVVWVWR